eukprot:TRINITY_DN13956_c0_g1_i1.p1 TRINITY_DN13956_c0_g1~~TRINITY_DN13956_c0_g1_i1.p1  ORF type:complete len:489 (+),score=76.16 TRINITY_DN13956_c0_g1_i1:168-1634(+)
MLSRTAALCRIGVFLDPTFAGIGRPSGKSEIIPTDITTEAGYFSGSTEKQQLKQQEERFAEQSEATIKNIEETGKATYGHVSELISVGGIDQGLDMFEFLNKRNPANGKELSAIIKSLSIPTLVSQWRELSEGFNLDALKRAGSHRGHQRTREADHLISLLFQRTSGDLDSDLRLQGFNNLLSVYNSSGYTAVNEVPDRLYDEMFTQELQPNATTYAHLITALGLTTRMEELDALWSWLQGPGVSGRLPILYSAVIDAYIEAERYLDVHSTFSYMKVNNILPTSSDINSLVLAIWRHSRSAGGTIPAAEEKRLIFITQLARQSGVHMSDIAKVNQNRVQNAVKRWTYRRGLSKTTRPMLDDKKHEYEAWCEGQRWKHLGEDDMNTSIIESAIRKMRGDDIDQRMRLDVERGGGRGVIYPPKPERAVTRYDKLGDSKQHILWDRSGVSSSLHGTAYVPPSDAEFSRRLQHSRRIQGGGKSSSVWKSGRA